MIKSRCPVCDKVVEDYVETPCVAPFLAHDPAEGLLAWGPYSASKIVLCQTDTHVHFVFDDTGDERLVRMGVKS